MLFNFSLFLLITLPVLEASLKTQILANYSRTDLPPEVSQGPVNVSLSLALYQLIDFDVETQSVYCLFWQRAAWKDSRLAWGNSKPSSDTKYMRFAYEDIWMPDILPYEDIGVYDVWKYKNTILLRAAPDGTVLWLAPAPMKTVCSLEMTNFPYDSHTCEVTITPWQYDNTEVVLACDTKHLDLDNFEKSMEWEVTETNCTELTWGFHFGQYDAVKFFITYRRLQRFYVRLLIWPNIALLTLSSLMFFLPSGSSDRPNFGMTVLLTLTVNLMIITDFIPEASRSFPRICNYFLGSILLCAIGVLLVCIIDHASSFGKSETEGSNCGSYCVGTAEKEGDGLESRNSMKKKLVSNWIQLLVVIKENENFIGFIYFLSTLVAHLTSYFKINL